MSLCVMITGGTIDKVHDPISEKLIFPSQSHIQEILKTSNISDINYQMVMMKDSLDIKSSDRELIKEEILRRQEDKIVITHGTSTMSDTAEYIAKHCNNKTIVLTGAMRPYSLYKSDAEFNLGGAVVAAQILPHGVYLVMNGTVFNSGNVIKNTKEGIFLKANL